MSDGPPIDAHDDTAPGEAVPAEAEAPREEAVTVIDAARPALGSAETREPGRDPRLGRFVLLDELGRGGMGVVHAAYDPQLERKVAIKVIRTGDGEGLAAGSLDQERFLREAKAMARLSHDSVARVYDVGVDRGRLYIAMELIDGVTLSRWLEDHPSASVDEKIAVFVRAGLGLAAAHDAGLVHRDFKPSNVLVTEAGRVVVLDFGVARTVTPAADSLASGDAPGLSDAPPRFAEDATLTAPGTQVGTPLYMAPEQLEARTPDARTDQYALCLVAWQALAGTHPFPREAMLTRVEAMRALRLAEPERDLPPHVRAALLRGLAYDPDERWPSVRELLGALAPRRRRVGAWLVGGSAVAAVAAAVALGTRGAPDPCGDLATRVGQVWNADVGAALVRAIGGGEEPDAADRAEELRGSLDDYAQRWLRVATLSCEAAHVAASRTRPEHERTMTCLGDGLAQLDAIASVGGGSSAVSADAVAGAVGRLPRPQGCAVVPAARYDRAQWKGLDDARNELEQIGTLLGLGDLEQAEARLDALREQVDVVTRPVIAARVLFQDATLRLERGEAARAVEQLVDASAIALSIGDDRGFAECAHRMVFAFSHEGRFREGKTIGALGLAAIERVGGDPELELSLRLQLGQLLQMSGAFDEARQELARAEELARLTFDEGSSQLQAVLTAMANLAWLEGNLEEAEARFSALYDSIAQVRDPTHREALAAEQNLLNVRLGRGVLASEVGRLDDFVARVDATFGPAHINAARARGLRGDAALVRQDYRAALEDQRRAVEIFGSNGAQLARAGQMLSLAASAAHLGEAQTVREALAEADRIVAASVPEGHEYRVDPVVALADAELTLGDLPRAQAAAEEALRRLGSTPEDEGSSPNANLIRGRVALAKGELPIALDRLARAQRGLDADAQQWALRAEARIERAAAIAAGVVDASVVTPEGPSSAELLDEAEGLLRDKLAPRLEARLGEVRAMTAVTPP